MATFSILIIVIAVAVIAVLAVVAVVVTKQQADSRRARAEQLRVEATTQTPVLDEAEARAQEAEARADDARAIAARARARAEEARQEVEMDQAHQEHTLREADRIDPDVNHRADGYSPTTPQDRRTDETAGPA